jgi:plastocyanin
MGHRLLILIAAATLIGVPASVGAGGTGSVAGKVSVRDADGKPAAGAEVIVYIVGFKEDGDRAAPPVVLSQKDRKFVPDLVAITVGESVSFPNDDPFLHNVFSQSTARRFDLGSFKRGDAKKKDFPNPGVIDVYCNIHPEMAATILVLPNRRHARVAADGSYTLTGLPAGEWTIFAYTRRADRPASAAVTVEAGRDAHVDLSLVRRSEPEHLNKYGEKYRDTGATYHSP